MERQVTQHPNLDHFLPPQETTHATALAELTAGRKVTHWIWWEMPQLKSLGRSRRAYDYGLADLEEAQAFLAHPLLGPRLVELCQAVLRHGDKSADDIMGPVDALKLRSMATLFASVPNTPEVFQSILTQFFDSKACPLTREELSPPFETQR